MAHEDFAPRETKTFRLAFPYAIVTIETDQFRDRREVASAVRRGAVMPVAVTHYSAHAYPKGEQRQYVNFGLVERILT